MQQWPALFHKLSVRIDLSKRTQGQGTWVFVESAQWMEGYINPSLEPSSGHHSWALLRAGVSHLFLHIPDNRFGWGEAKNVYSFWAPPTSAQRFPPLGRRADLDLLTRRNQALGLLQCRKFPLVGAWPPLNDYSLHFLFHYAWFCPLGKISAPMAFIMQTRVFMSCTLFEEASLSRAEASSNGNEKINQFLHVKTAVSVEFAV